MAGNSLTFQTLNDGPRNTTIKVVGILDSADIVSQTVTAGITNLSGVITYATTTTLVVGQRVTGTGIPNNAYIGSVQAGVSVTLANGVVATATNASASITFGSAVLFDPAVMAKVDDFGTGLATKGRIDRLVFTIEPLLECRLWWDATAPIIITDLDGAAHQELYKFGGYQNQAISTAAAGANGMITLSTQGWSASAVLSFNILMEIVKQK